MCETNRLDSFSPSCARTTKTIGSSSDKPGPVNPLSDNRDVSSTAVWLESDSNRVLVAPVEKPSILHRCFFTDEAVSGGKVGV